MKSWLPDLCKQPRGSLARPSPHPLANIRLPARSTCKLLQAVILYLPSLHAPESGAGPTPLVDTLQTAIEMHV